MNLHQEKKENLVCVRRLYIKRIRNLKDAFFTIQTYNKHTRYTIYLIQINFPYSLNVAVNIRFPCVSVCCWKGLKDLQRVCCWQGVLLEKACFSKSV